MSDEKTEEPTDKKLRDAKKKGQQVKSQDAAAAVSLMGMTLCLYVAAGHALKQIHGLLTRTLDMVGGVSATSDLTPLMVATLADGMLAIAPFVFASLLLGLIGQLMQVGFNVSFEPVTPKFENLNPAQGLKKMFSMKSVIEFIKTLIKAVALVVVLYVVITDLIGLFAGASYLPVASIAVVGWNAMFKLLGAGILIFLVVAPVDYGLQWFLFRKDQRMSKDEVKREYKEMEGDPQIKSQRKQIAREMANSGPRQSVPGATVVVTNPTHYAVALYYESGKTALPIVVAKGADEAAAEIRKIAEENGVPMMSDPPLARALFRLPLNEPIPRPMFEAVAAVLIWVQSVHSNR